MANVLALEWDNREARIVVARRRGASTVIEHAFTVDLGPREVGDTLADPDIGERISAGLVARHIGRCDTLVAVGRSGLELRLLSLPPAPDEELPEMVRFQAMKQFSALGDDWPLDFLPIEQRDDGTRSVLAAAISPELVTQVQKTCEVAQLRPRRLILRPCAAASLLLRQHQGRDSHQVRMLVDVLADEADLTVTVDETVVFLRTVKVPGEADSAQQIQVLLGEIRRTIAAAQNQLGGQRVEQITLFGADVDLPSLRAQITEKLDLPVAGFDPFEGLSLSKEVRGNTPEYPARFAPLLGMLVDECAGVPHTIDFLNPRKKLEPPSRNRLYAIAGAAAAVLVVAAIGFLWMRLAGLKNTETQMRVQLTELEKTAEQAQQLRDEAKQIDQWLASDVTWLDEMRRLAEQLPPPDKARLTRFQIQINTGVSKRGGPQGGGMMDMVGYADDHQTISAVEKGLRDTNHDVESDGGRREGDDPKYPWRFSTSVTVHAPEPPTLEELASEMDTSDPAEPPQRQASEEKPTDAEPTEAGPTDTEPADTEPADTEPADTEPADTEPADTEPADTEPADTEPADTEPADTEPADTEPADTEPADTEPADTEPADTEPADTEPADTEPADTEPADTEPEDEESPSDGSSEDEPADGDAMEDQPVSEGPAEAEPAEEESGEEESGTDESGDEELAPNGRLDV